MVRDNVGGDVVVEGESNHEVPELTLNSKKYCKGVANGCCS